MRGRRRISPGVFALCAAAVLGCATAPSRPDRTAAPIDAALDELRAGRMSLSRGEALRHYRRAAVMASSLVFSGDPASAEEITSAVAVHNEALERFLRLGRGPRRNLDADWARDMADEGAPIRTRSCGVWNPDDFDRLEFASDHTAFPLRTIFRQDGLGVAMFSVRRRRADDPARLRGPDRFQPPLEVHAVTLVLRPTGPDGMPTIEACDPVSTDVVPASSGPTPLAADLSTPLLFQFARSILPIRDQIKRLNPNHLEWTAGLHMLHPYEPGKIPVVFVHGYLVTHRDWLQAVNELRGDPEFRSRYQLWIYTYPSINPFLHSAALLRNALRDARATFDPTGADPAFGRTVVVGHSLGGLLAKALVVDGGDPLWSLVARRPPNELAATPEQKAMLNDVFFFRAQPDVARVVFIATPHRGSPYPVKSFGQIAARLTPHRGPLIDLCKELKEVNPPEVFNPEFYKYGLATCFDQFREGEPLLEALDRRPIAPGVAFNSIIAQHFGGPVEDGFDGILRYRSAHLEGAESETIIRHNHFVTGEPETIDELKRILRLHAP